MPWSDIITHDNVTDYLKRRDEGSRFPETGKVSITDYPAGVISDTHGMVIGPNRIYLAFSASGNTAAPGVMAAYDWSGQRLPNESFPIASSRPHQVPNGLILQDNHFYVSLRDPSNITLQYVYPYSKAGAAGTRIWTGGRSVNNFPGNTLLAGTVLLGRGSGHIEVWSIYSQSNAYAVVLSPSGNILSYTPITGLGNDFYFVVPVGIEYFVTTTLGGRNVTALSSNYQVQSANGGQLRPENDRPGAMAAYGSLIGVWDTDGSVYFYGQEPFVPQPLESYRQLVGMQRFTRLYDVITLGSGRAITAKKAIGIPMLNESAIDEITFGPTGTPTLTKQLETLRFTPKMTIPNADAGDVIVDNQGIADSYPTILQTGIPTYEIDGFQTVEHGTYLVRQIITATLQSS